MPEAVLHSVFFLGKCFGFLSFSIGWHCTNSRPIGLVLLFCCYALELCHKSPKMSIFPCAFLYKQWSMASDLCLSFNLSWVTLEYSEGRGWSHSSACGYQHWVPKGLFLPCDPLAALLRTNCPQIHVDSILFYWPKYLFLFQYHTVLITIALWHTLNSNCDRPLALLFWGKKMLYIGLFVVPCEC